MSTSVTLEDLRDELKQKEANLELAACLGKNLLEENEKLKQDLNSMQQDLTSLEQELESQKHASTRTLSEAKMVAELHISELEDKLEKCQHGLKLEKACALSAKQEFSRSLEQLNKENFQLKECLSQVTEEHKVELKQLCQRLEEAEEQRKIITQDRSQVKVSIEELQDVRETLSQNLSSMHGSCEQLSMEIGDLREEASFWEDQYHSQEVLLQYQNRELSDSRDLLDHLQLQLSQDLPVATTVHRTVSTASLYDELSEVEDEGEEGRSSSDSAPFLFSDNGDRRPTIIPAEDIGLVSKGSEDSSQDIDRNLTIKRRAFSSSKDCTTTVCQRCQELEAKNIKKDAELKDINEMLLLAVHQKLKLYEQLEAWEFDMAGVIHAQIKQKLTKERISTTVKV